jgi:hypothetical protein
MPIWRGDQSAETVGVVRLARALLVVELARRGVRVQDLLGRHTHVRAREEPVFQQEIGVGVREGHASPYWNRSISRLRCT